MQEGLSKSDSALSLASGSWSFWRDESGQDLVEYGLISCLVGLVAIASVKGLGSVLATKLLGISTSMNSAL